MSVGYGNLDTYVKGLVNGNYPDIGQVHYLVDSNFRTVAQGWSRADGTGPLDLYAARQAGRGGIQYVYRTGDYNTDTLAMQAAIDAVVDFRGDIVFLTPGSYNPLTSVLVDGQSMRLLGPPVRNQRRTRVTITSVGGATNTLDISSGVDDVELGFFRLVPLTAGNSLRYNASDGLYVHNIFWDANGVAASTSTQGFVSVTASSLYPEFRDNYFFVDAAQGDAMEITLTDNLVATGNSFVSDAGTWANVILTSATTLSAHFDLNFLLGRGAVTNMFTGVAGADQVVCTRLYVSGGVLATATAVETGFDATLGFDIAESYQTGDATTQGGTLILLA